VAAKDAEAAQTATNATAGIADFTKKPFVTICFLILGDVPIRQKIVIGARVKCHMSGIPNAQGGIDMLIEEIVNALIRWFHLPQSQQWWDGGAVPRLHGMDKCGYCGRAVQSAIVADAMAT
jgi:hypothetical protein